MPPPQTPAQGGVQSHPEPRDRQGSLLQRRLERGGKRGWGPGSPGRLAAQRGALVRAGCAVLSPRPAQGSLEPEGSSAQGGVRKGQCQPQADPAPRLPAAPPRRPGEAEGERGWARRAGAGGSERCGGLLGGGVRPQRRRGPRSPRWLVRVRRLQGRALEAPPPRQLRPSSGQDSGTSRWSGTGAAGAAGEPGDAPGRTAGGGAAASRSPRSLAVLLPELFVQVDVLGGRGAVRQRGPLLQDVVLVI